jgi:hypothetical protein
MQALSPAPLQAPISLMEKTPGILELLLHDTSADFLRWKPASECWSILEVLAHLAAIEQSIPRASIESSWKTIPCL